MNNKEQPDIRVENIAEQFESKFINVYDLQYAPGKHYYDATRRKKEDLVAVKSDEEFRKMLPDAVMLFVIVQSKGQEYLLLFYEYRYPTGRFLLSPPAGLIDAADKEGDHPIYTTAIRELHEETGLQFREGIDAFHVLNPLAFSSPGMTDESNAIALMLLKEPELSQLSNEFTEGSELLSGYQLFDKERARECLATGRDEYGNFFSIYTWQNLLYFISDLWKEL